MEHVESGAGPVRDGGVKTIPVRTPKGTFQVWTRRAGSSPRMKLLLLHGGPASTHEYFECLEAPLTAAGIEVIFYDQLGSAFSDQPDDEELWTVERFVDEVEQVRQALGLGPDDFYLLGHSWGGILAIEYALAHQAHLKGLVISNMMSDAGAYAAYAERVLATQMDPAVLAEIRALEAAGDVANPRYMDLLVTHYYAQHICRLPEWPDAVNRAFAHLNQAIYSLMQGPSEFGISGRLQHWDRRADLARIAVPTLVIGAAHDTMDPAHMEWMSGQVQDGTYLHCPDGSHLCMWDDHAAYVAGLVRFIQQVDAR